jgi:hypothetical protein
MGPGDRSRTRRALSGVAIAIACASPPIAATGCHSEAEKEIDSAATRDRELSRRPVSRTASPVVVLPSSSRWKSARVEVVWERPNEGGQGGTPLTVADWLVLTSERGDERRLLERFPVHDRSDAGQWRDFIALVDGSVELAAASDGHALIVSWGGRRGYVALDAGPEPLFCPHVAVPDAKDAPQRAPSTRGLVLELLAGTHGLTPTRSGTLQSSSNQAQMELGGAGRYVCAHAEDAPLASAAAGALVRGAAEDLASPLRQCIPQIAQRDAAVRSVLVGALSKPEQGVYTLGPLAESGTDDAVSAVAKELDALARKRCTSRVCEYRAKLAWALARSRVPPPSVPSVENALIAVTTRLVGGLGADADYDRVAQRYAVIALKKLSTPAALRTLRKLASRPCNDVTVDWPGLIGAWDDASQRSALSAGDPSCWARKAVTRE